MYVCAFVCIHEFIKRIMNKGYVNSRITLNFIISVYTFNYKNKHLFMDAQTIAPPGKLKGCDTFKAVFTVINIVMLFVWLFNLGYSNAKYFDQIKVLNVKLVQFYYIYSAICMFVTVAILASILVRFDSHWYLIFALFGIGHIVTSAVVLNIIIPKMDKDESLRVLKNNVKIHVVIDILFGIIMVISSLLSHYYEYKCTLKSDYM